MADSSTPIVQEASNGPTNESQHLPDSDEIILLVQGTSIPCNKSVLTTASPYFAAMFRGDFAEARACAVPISDVTASSMQAVVERLTAGSLDWEAQDPLDILYTTSVLQLDEVQTDCIRYISEELNTQNCLSVMFKADQLGLDTLHDSASLMSQWAFETIIESDSFLSLSFEEVSHYLSGDLLVSSESKVVEAIHTWIARDQQQRQQYLKDLLRHLEYSEFSFTELLQHSYLLNDYSYLCDYVPSTFSNSMKACGSYLQQLTSSVWAMAEWGRKIEETPLIRENNNKRNIPAKVYLVATGVKQSLERYNLASIKIRMNPPPDDYLQSKLYYLCPDQRTLKLSSLNSHLAKEDIGTVVKIIPVDSQVWVVAYKEETVTQPVFSFWKFSDVLQRWLYVCKLPPHIRGCIDWLVYVKNHIYIVYEPFGRVIQQVMDVYNVLTKQWTQHPLPLDEDLKNLENDKAIFFSYQSHLYLIGSWFKAGISLAVTSQCTSIDDDWKRIVWCTYTEKEEILQCVVDKADIYALSFSGLYKLQIQGENVLRCDYISKYEYGEMYNDHDICFRLFSKKVQMSAGRIYCWRKTEVGHLSIFDVEKRKERNSELQYETSSEGYKRRWHGFHIVLDSCFILPDRVDTLTV